jgi:hypothetical protein
MHLYLSKHKHRNLFSVDFSQSNSSAMYRSSASLRSWHTFLLRRALYLDGRGTKGRKKKNENVHIEQEHFFKLAEPKGMKAVKNRQISVSFSFQSIFPHIYLANTRSVYVPCIGIMCSKVIEIKTRKV